MRMWGVGGGGSLILRLASDAWKKAGAPPMAWFNSRFVNHGKVLIGTRIGGCLRRALK